METKTVPTSASSTVLNKDAVLTSIKPEERIRSKLLFLSPTIPNYKQGKDNKEGEEHLLLFKKICTLQYSFFKRVG